MNFIDHFTSIDDLLVKLLERIGGVTEEDTHFFSYPNDGTRATITKGTTTLDFMSGTVMTPAGVVSSLGNSLRARGREYCRSLSLQADRDMIIQIGTKSKIPVFAGTWFKVAHLRFTEVKIIAADTTRIFAIACTNPDSIEMAGETYVRDAADARGNTFMIGLAELASRIHAPPITFDRRGDVLRWEDFESSTPHYEIDTDGTPEYGRSADVSTNNSFSYKTYLTVGDRVSILLQTADFSSTRFGHRVQFSSSGRHSVVTLYSMWFDGVTRTTAAIKYTLSNGMVEIRDENGNFVSIGMAPAYRDITNFSTLKMVADVAGGHYLRALAMGQEFDISDYGVERAPDATEKYLLTNTMVQGTVAYTDTVYLDNIIITENEPI